ncbi:hypothetical protein [Shewanella woodyi]|uniref:Uncharacterized protein n=1 Tax=Shewanella woodyi (strain ATCC 51908 / MS32) TaxID=392500 RepID=B1KKB9_SHEWM|nr:hypothetical protein [Shewanella woodyi]ACA85759.1 hypothetical protein Swoo_1471 [Shewanella woodyi ATCC 51908]
MKYFLMLFLILQSFSSFAAHHCLGKVVNLDIAGNGNIHANISGIGNGNVICSTKTKLGEYEPEACRVAFSLLLSAKMSDSNIRLYFRDDTNTSCFKGNWTNLGSQSHGLYYIRMEG